MITQNEKHRFDAVCRDVLTSEHLRSGIGTLGERTLHLILKKYFEPDDTCHEQKIGRFVADIRNGGGITEIQTRQFSAMRKKLTAFTKEYPVNVVFPIAATKQLTWVDPESGELSEKRKSPKKGQPWDILRELYALRPIMPLDNVKFTLVFTDMDEFKLLDGWSRDKKRGASRYERIPTALCDIITLDKPSDYSILVPPTLGDDFTAAELAKAAKMTPRAAGYAIRTLVTLGVIEHTDTKGKAYIYTRKVQQNETL